MKASPPFWILLFLTSWIGNLSTCRWCESVEPRAWPVELKVGRFEIHSDFNVTHQTSLTPELTSLSSEISELLHLPAGSEPVHIVIFETAGEYQRYMRNYFPALPERRALFIQDRGPGMLFAHWHPDIATDLRHEMTHAMLNEGPRPLPLWLDEGLAEYFEVASNKRFTDNDYVKPVAARAAQGLVPSLKLLEAIDDLQDFKDVQYRDSWSWVHFLIHRSAASRELLVNYLQRHRSGSEQLALSRQLQQLSPDVSTDYCAHFASLPSRRP